MMEPDDYDDEDDLSSCASGDGPLFTIDDDEINIGGVIPDTEEVLRQELVEEAAATTTRQQRTRVGCSAVAGGVTGALLAVPLVAVSVTAMAITGPIVGVTAAGGAAYVAATTTGSPMDLARSSSNNKKEQEEQEEGDTVVFYNDIRHPKSSPATCSSQVPQPVQQVEQEEESFTVQAPNRLRWVPGVFQRNLQTVVDSLGKETAALQEDTDASSSELDIQDQDYQEDYGEKKHAKPISVNTGLRTGGMMWVLAAQAERYQEEQQPKAQTAPAETDVPSEERGGMFRWMAQRRKNQADSAPLLLEAVVCTTPTKAPKDAEDDEKTVDSPALSEASADTPSPSRTWMPPVLARKLVGINQQLLDGKRHNGIGGSSCSGSSYDGESGEDNYYSDDVDDESDDEEVVFGHDDESISGHCAPKSCLFSGDDLVEGTTTMSNSNNVNVPVHPIV